MTTSYKSILVHVDGSERCETRIDMAARLAAAFDAHLIGLAVAWAPPMPTQISVEMGAEFVERFRGAQNERARRLAEAFEQRARRVGATRLESRVAEMHPEDAVCLHGRYADLVVLGQYDPDSKDDDADPDLAEQVVLRVGRPVLMVPYAGRFERIGGNVMVAWNASREASRAITDSIPLLQRAQKVSVYVVEGTAPAGSHGDAPGADIALFLARHGITAEAVRNYSNEIDVGNWLLSRAADIEADLIVMGAYGQSRMRELVLGGVTRTLFQHMTVPVLMSH